MIHHLKNESYLLQITIIELIMPIFDEYKTLSILNTVLYDASF